MKHLCLLGLVLPLAFVSEAGAQSVIRGTIVDAETGEALPAATIQVEGTYRGTITNVDGLYELGLDALGLDALPVTLIIRYIGYETERRVLSASSSDLQNFQLRPVVYEAEEVVITGEDPAIRIMREVIERKKVWRAALETYDAIAYNRFAISNDTGIVSIIETVTEAFWDKERGIREVLKARRETSNMEIEALPAALFVTNLYDDDIEISGHNLMGVTHPDALSEYRFILEGTRRLNDQTVFDISVRPKRRTKSAFVGRVSVLDSAYAMIDVELTPGESFVFPPPLERFDVTYRQQFSNFGGDYWLPVDFRAELELKLSFGFLLSFPSIGIAQVSRFTDYHVNSTTPDSLFEDDDILVVDSASVASDLLLATEGVAVPLSESERIAYVEIDSTLAMSKAFAPSGLLAQFVKVDTEDNEDRRRRKASSSSRKLLTNTSVVPELWYNRVDQFHGGAEVRLDFLRRLTLSGGAGYNIAPDSVDRWTYRVRGKLEVGSARRAFVEGGYQFGSVTRYDSQLYSRLLNGAAVVLGGADYYDYYQREGFDVAVGYGFRWSEATLTFGYRQEDHSSLAKTVAEVPLGDRVLRPNPEIQPGRLKALVGTVSIGDRENTFGAVGRNRLLVQVEQGGGDFGYTRFAVVGDLRLPTFFRRRLIPNTLDIHMVAGTRSGELPLQRFGTVEGS